MMQQSSRRMQIPHEMLADCKLLRDGFSGTCLSNTEKSKIPSGAWVA